MTTSTEFIKAGVTGQTFREIREKFGKPWSAIADSDPIDANYALAFAWFREQEHLAVPAAFDKAMTLTNAQIEALFEDEEDVEVKKQADFGSPSPATTPQ